MSDSADPVDLFANRPDLRPSAEELADIDPAAAEEMTKELARVRSQILGTEASTIVANHALGIYELAAIHLTADEPNFAEAKLAIDALAALVEKLEGRLGDTEDTLREALANVQMGFVQRRQQLQGDSE